MRWANVSSTGPNNRMLISAFGNDGDVVLVCLSKSIDAVLPMSKAEMGSQVLSWKIMSIVLDSRDCLYMWCVRGAAFCGFCCCAAGYEQCYSFCDC